MRVRITRAILLVAGMLVLVLGIPLAVAVQEFYESRAVVELQRQAAETTVELSLPLVPAELEQAAAEDDSPGPFSVYDPAGTRLVGNGPARADEPVRQALGGQAGATHHGNELIVATPIADQSTEAIVGAVRVTQPAAVVAGEARRAWLLMLAVAGVGLVGALLVARRQASILAEPVARLADQAAVLGRGDLTTRPALSGIAEVDAVAGALEDSATRMTGLLARERSFSADVSHQLRTPLAGLRLRLERARRDADLDAIDGALAEVDRLTETVDHLLDLARDTRSVSPPLDLDALLQAVDERWQPRVADAGRTLLVGHLRPAPNVNASSVSISQVLDVLVDNALRHGSGAIGVRARGAAGGLVLEVDDQGPGIPDSLLEAVFDRRTADGHGIGLALARTITEAEGGRLLLVSGQPPLFHLVLPVATGEAEATPTTRPEPAG